MKSAIRRARLGLCALLLACFLAGCATSSQIRLLSDDPPDIPPRMELTEVPFFPQQEYHCGPAALAGVMNYRGVEVLPDQIADLVYVPGLKGSLQVEVVAAARQFDLLPVELDGSLEALLREVAAANPVFLLQNLGLDIYPVWHYEILIGYDLEQRLVILRSGVNRRITRSFSTFEKTWQRAGRWALVIVDAGSIPVSAGADAYLDAVIGMEQTGSVKIARQAYTTALRRWPENPLALGGLGNSAYALGDYADAERAYRAALALDPTRAELWNNLAYALMQLGKREAALAAVARARLLDPGNSNYQDSQSELDSWP